MSKIKILNRIYKLKFKGWTHEKFDRWLKRTNKHLNKHSTMRYNELENAVMSSVRINSMKDLFNG